MKKYLIPSIILVCFFSLKQIDAQNKKEYSKLAKEAEKSLEEGIAFMQTLAIEGGYVHYYSLDGKEKWGEGKTDDHTIEIEAPGTPAIGMSFLRAWKVTGNKDFLKAAENVAHSLALGQNDFGGWEQKIHFNQGKGKKVSLDDNQSQGAISFLIALDKETDSPELTATIEKAMNMMLASQLESGGWPHDYPEQGTYDDFATFNDQGINDCIRVMIEAYSYYKKDEYLESLNKAIHFLRISQLPPPQSGWAQQYNQYLQPAWARTFEPPSVCPMVTVFNIQTLIDLYETTDNGYCLEPIPDALRWLKESRLPNGKWGRFLELGTNKPLYYDRGRIRVNSFEELSLERRTGYAYETDIARDIEAAESRFLCVLGKKEKDPAPDPNEVIKELAEKAEKAIENQDDQGRWIVHNDKFRKQISVYKWNGEYRIEDRISSALFNKNIEALCEFLEEYKLMYKN